MHAFILLVNETPECGPVEPELEEREETVVEPEATQGKKLSMLKYLLLQSIISIMSYGLHLGISILLSSRSYLMHLPFLDLVHHALSLE